MSSSSQSSHSPSGTLASVDEEFLSPHILPVSPTAHPVDRDLYQELSVIQDDFLTVASLDDSALLSFAKRWSELQSRISRHHPQGYLSEETLQLFDIVSDFVMATAQSLIDGEHSVDSVSEELLAELEKIFDAEPSLIPYTKVSKPLAASSSQPSLVPFKKSPVQCKRAPTEPLKTHRKRRAESGIPGQESLKFRPCRDFFMAHLSDPYPNPTQKTELMQKAKISAASLNQWFTNTRRRSNWMDIMKDHANGRKEDMKALVERCLSGSSDGGPAIPPKAREAVLKMRTYVDELAREVISDTFLEVLEELTVMTENDAVKYQDGQRSERKKKNQIKREATSSSLADDGQMSEGEAPKLLEKRKRPLAPAEALPSKKPREANWVGSSMPPPASASRSLKRSRESSPTPYHPSGAEAGSPSKKLRVEVEDSFPAPMNSSPGHLKATTSLQSISTSSTIVDSIAPPQSFSMQPVAVDPPADDLDWPMGRSSVDIVVPSPDLVTDLSGLTFDPSPFQSLRKTIQSAQDTAVACAEWIKSLPKDAPPDLSSTPIAASFVPPPSAHHLSSSLEGIEDFWFSVAQPVEPSSHWHMSPTHSFPPHTPVFTASPVPSHAGIPRQYSAPAGSLGPYDYSSPQSQLAYPTHQSNYPSTAYSMPPPFYSDSKSAYTSHTPTTPIIADSSPPFSWNENQYQSYGGELAPLDIRIPSDFYAASQ